MTDDVLVTADWVESNLDAFQDDDSDLRLVEINNPTVTDESEYTPYEEGHIPGALNFEWDEVFTDETERDIVSKADFAERTARRHRRRHDGRGVRRRSRPELVRAVRLLDLHVLRPRRRARDRRREGVLGRQRLPALHRGARLHVPRVRGPRSLRERPRVQGRHRQGDRGGIPMVDVRSPEEFSGEVIAPRGSTRRPSAAATSPARATSRSGPP